MRKLWVTAILLVCSCNHPPVATQEEVNSLVRRCGLEGKIEFRWISSNKLAITRLDADTDSGKFMCVSRGLDARGFKLGFEGREQLN
jgi:hypothetical protein